MKPEEVSRWPEEGQYWAMLHPVALARMGPCAPEDTGVLYRWTPDADEEQVCFVFPLLPDKFRHLWFTRRSTYHSALVFVPGDVWLYLDRTGQQRLFFIGPETTRKEVVIHADHAVTFLFPQDPRGSNPTLSISAEYTPDLHLYQPGYGRKIKPARSAWEVINRDE